MSANTDGESSAKNWPESGLEYDGYVHCYRAALVRLAATINPALFNPGYLRKSDSELSLLFQGDDTLKKIHLLRIIQGDPKESLEDRAEDHFYGRFVFKTVPAVAAKRALGSVCQVVHEATDTFIDWSWQRLHRPRGNAGTFEKSEFPSERAFAEHCAANYLLKNFWHNFVHEQLQGIRHDNYRSFGGDARFDSDFEADNLANLFLVHAYGVPVYTAGSIGEANTARMQSLFGRNLCNLVFMERAQHRQQDRASMSAREGWEDYEWRVRRRLANHLSQELILRGLAAGSLAIYFSGQLLEGNRGPYRKGTVVAVVNGIRLDSGLPPYLPSDQFASEFGGKTLGERRRTRIRQLQNVRRDEIVLSLVGKYRQLIRKDASHRNYSLESLKLVFAHAGMKWSK